MKRYWVFASDRFWPRGGDADLFWQTDDLKEAEWVRYNLSQFTDRWVVDIRKWQVPADNEELVRQLFDDLAEGEVVTAKGGRRRPIR